MKWRRSHIRQRTMRSIRRSTLAEPSQRYLQAIPLYTSSDVEVSRYFSEHHEEIDVITGTALVIALPSEVQAGNISAIAALFSPGIKNSRYPGLLRSDLPCFWLEDSTGGHEIIRLPNNLYEVNAYVRAMTDAAEKVGTAKEIKLWVDRRLQANTDDRSPLLRVLLRELSMNKSTERLIATLCGVAFVVAILALAVFIPNPQPFQYQVFRIVLSIASAGFVSMTPGFLEVTVSNWVRAGGALAVFVIVFFYNPAALLVAPA